MVGRSFIARILIAIERSPRQAQLANAFCRLLELAQPVAQETDDGL